MTSTAPEQQNDPAPLWLRSVAFILLVVPLWAIASFCLAAAVPSSPLEMWQFAGALIPAALVAGLLILKPSAGFLLGFIALAWIGGGTVLYLGSMSGIWPWLHDTARSTVTAAPPAPTPVPTAPAPAAPSGPVPVAPAPAAPSGPGAAGPGTGTAAPPWQSLPEFPWPPPAASATYVLPRALFDVKATLGQVTSAIVAALERNGYVERSFFRTGDDGVALVTRLERMNDDGTPPPESERWPGALKSQDLVSVLRGLFYVDHGHYRLIVFILQDRPFTQSSEQVTDTEARRWLRSGANVLPREIAERPFGDGSCTALIYEFASDGTAVKVVESQLTGRQHLEKAGVLAVLEKAK